MYIYIYIYILKGKKTNIMIPKKNIDIFFYLLDKDSYDLFGTCF